MIKKFIICTLHQIIGSQIEEGERGWHVVCMKQMINLYKILGGKPEG
jgi:hypothetical protein